MSSARWANDLVPFGVTLTFGENSARIALSGEFDVATGSALVDAATSAVARYKFVDLDFGGVSFIDSCGVRAVIKVKRFADAYGALLAVSGVDTKVREVFEIAGVAEVLGLGDPPA